MIFNWVLSYFLIVEGLTVVSLLPVHLETQKYRNDSINIVLDIDVPQGLQSPLMNATFESIHIRGDRLNVSSTAGKNTSDTEGNLTLSETEQKEEAQFTNSNDTDYGTNVWHSRIIFTKFTDEVIVTTVVLLILILLQDHVLSDTFSHQLHKLSILTVLVLLFSLMFVALVNFACPDSTFAILMGFCLIAVHSRSYLIWSWRRRSRETSCTAELLRVPIYTSIGFLVRDVRHETDIFVLIKSWIVIYLLAFSINYLYLMSILWTYYMENQNRKLTETRKENRKDKCRSNSLVHGAENDDKKVIYGLFFMSFVVYVCMKAGKLSLKEDKEFDIIYPYVIKFTETLFVAVFWFLRIEWDFALVDLKEQLSETHHCTNHSTEDIVGFGIIFLNWISSSVGSRYFKKNQENNEKECEDEDTAKFTKSYGQFECTVCVLCQNSFYLYIVHLVMTIAFLCIA